MNDTEHQDVPTESRLSQILATTAEQMLSEFKKIRISFDHNGMAGEGGETVVAEFLRSQLPQSIGICTGEILDVTGQTSKQEDVILYDAEHTPMLFADQNKKLARIPAEGVLGVVEVKTHLRSRDIEICLANCRSVKQLVRTAYFPQAIQTTHTIYGKQYVNPPIYYTVFAATSDNLYAGKLNEIQEDVPIDQRIDSVCCLDRGVNVNLGLNLSNGIEHVHNVMSARSLPKGAMANSTTKNPLLIWYAMLASSVMQFPVRPIDVTKYMEKELIISACIPDERSVKSVTEDAINALAHSQGLDPDLLRKSVTPGANLSARECYQVLRAPGFTFSSDLSAQALNTFEKMRQLAQNLPFDQWITFLSSSLSDEEHS